MPKVPKIVESLCSFFNLIRQNTLFDVERSMFDVRCSLVSFSIKLAAFQASGGAEP
jgi:hypothetical protein